MDRRGLFAAAATLAMPNAARTQANDPGRSTVAWPDRPLRIIVPFPPGGGNDIWARMVAEAMQAELGQPILVENRAGAGGLLGAEAAAKAAPDGYTLLFHSTALVQAPITLRRFPYHPVQDFFPLGRLTAGSLAFCIGAGVPAWVSSLAGFVEWGRGRALAFGNFGQGSTSHAFAALLAQESGLTATQVSYRGETPMLQDLLAGSTHGGFHGVGAVAEVIRAKRIRPLATSGPDRMPSLAASVPTFLELGYSRRFGFTGFTGLFAPARVAPSILDRLAAAFRTAATGPEMLSRLQAMDTMLVYEDPATFRRSVEAAMRQWEELTVSLDLHANG